MNDIRMEPESVRRHAEILWDTKETVLKPEVDRIKRALLAGVDGPDCRATGTQSLGALGQAWAGADFGARHDEIAAVAVEFLDDLVDGYAAYANSAAAAAEAFTVTDTDSALAVHGICGGADFPMPGERG